jgi:GTP-binding protein
MGQNRAGGRGDDAVLKVPVGTEIYDADNDLLIADLTEVGQSVRILKGGNGGFGNTHFKSSTNRAPRRANPGEPSIERTLILRLKLIADAGLVGLPNAGKSTFLATVSAAKPKIADYPFTTLAPQLGVVASDGREFVLADIPGLIEGAHLGAGLGVQFLRHIERTRILVHLVDVSDASGRPDPVEDFKVIMEELKSFGHGLDEKPMIVVASKADVANPSKLKKLETMAKRKKLPFYAISAVTGLGVDKLKYAIGERVRELRKESAAVELKDAASAAS